MTQSFDVFFDLRPKNRFCKQSWGWWFETLSRSLWHHFNAFENVVCEMASIFSRPQCVKHLLDMQVLRTYIPCPWILINIDVASTTSARPAMAAEGSVVGQMRPRQCHWIYMQGTLDILLLFFYSAPVTLQWRHNGCDDVSNHQPHGFLLNRLFGRRSKKTSKLRVTGLCARNSPGTGEFAAQLVSNAENISIWWRYHELWDVYCEF